jgi:hypothetical protein
MLKLFQGCFRAYAEHPLQRVPVWIGDYVLQDKQELSWRFPVETKEIMLLLTFKDKMECEKKNIFNVDISKHYGSKDNVIIADSDFEWLATKRLQRKRSKS